jgi:hypothetical protein
LLLFCRLDQLLLGCYQHFLGDKLEGVRKLGGGRVPKNDFPLIVQLLEQVELGHEWLWVEYLIFEVQGSKYLICMIFHILFESQEDLDQFLCHYLIDLDQVVEIFIE